ncbi:hypothetical protein [Lactiplantibacillus carotarum]|uniref:hypothetical protein n=1 Tax=Lactiplantibacillus carotarum TaxID=2993456 RepID=UPI00298F3884|nr:hypothetical protein [Lactiplantibacillus carotarum]
MSPGWQKMLTGDAQRAQRLADLMRALNVTVDHRAGLSVLAEKRFSWPWRRLIPKTVYC